MNATAKPLPKWRHRLPLLIPAFLLLLAVGFAFSFHFYGIVGVTVPQGAVFLMGDNRNHSSDSRDERLGPVELEYIKGKAFYILSPAERSGPVS